MSDTIKIKDDIFKDLLDEKNGSLADSQHQRAMAAILVRLTSTISKSKVNGGYTMKCSFDSKEGAKLLQICLGTIFGDTVSLESMKIRETNAKKRYDLVLSDDIERIVRGLGLLNHRGGMIQGMPLEFKSCDESTAIDITKAAFAARGIAVSSETFSNRIEVQAPTLAAALALGAIFRRVGVDSSAREVRDSFRVTVRSNESLLKFLEVVGAKTVYASWQDSQELNAVKADVNRTVNFNYANIAKSADAAVESCMRVREAFEILDGDELSEKMRSMGELRLANPQATLPELAKLSESTKYPATKYTVLSRLNRIHALAMSKKNASH
jgi:DNA-binding protein WhiA